MRFLKKTKSFWQEKRGSMSDQPPPLPTLHEIHTATASLISSSRRNTIQKQYSTPRLDSLISAKMIRELRELIRYRYALDIEIWKQRDLKEFKRDYLQEKLRQSDATLTTIRATLDDWDRQEYFASKEEYDKFREIKDRLMSSNKVVWAKTPPWEFAKHFSAPVTSPYEMNSGKSSAVPLRGSYNRRPVTRHTHDTLQSPQQQQHPRQQERHQQQQRQFPHPQQQEYERQQYQQQQQQQQHYQQQQYEQQEQQGQHLYRQQHSSEFSYPQHQSQRSSSSQQYEWINPKHFTQRDQRISSVQKQPQQPHSELISRTPQQSSNYTPNQNTHPSPQMLHSDPSTSVPPLLVPPVRPSRPFASHPPSLQIAIATPPPSTSGSGSDTGAPPSRSSRTASPQPAQRRPRNQRIVSAPPREKATSRQSPAAEQRVVSLPHMPHGGIAAPPPSQNSEMLSQRGSVLSQRGSVLSPTSAGRRMQEWVNEERLR